MKSIPIQPCYLRENTVLLRGLKKILTRLNKNFSRLLTTTGMGTNILKKPKIEQLLIKIPAAIQMEKIETLVDEI